MPTQTYRLKNGVKVPGVTTVIGQLGWNKSALMFWSWSQGKEGLDFRATRDTAADLGTIVHALIETEMRGKKADLSIVPHDLQDKAQNALLAFWEWRDAYKLEPTGAELPLVSEQYHFGGTMDYPANVQGRRVILDLKTAKDIYPDNWIQVAAYGQLWNEANPHDPVTGYHILRVGKEDGGFAHHYKPSLTHEWEAFTHLLALYELKRRIEK